VSTEFGGPFSERRVLYFFDPPSAVPTEGFYPLDGRTESEPHRSGRPRPSRRPDAQHRFASSRDARSA